MSDDEADEPVNPLFDACGTGDLNQLRNALGSHGRFIDTPNNVGWTPLFNAAAKGHSDAIELLVQSGSRAIDTPILGGDTSTPMHAAAMSGHAGVVEILVRLGSKAIDAPERSGSTPMHLASSHGSTPVVEALVRLGSQAIDAVDSTGCTPMHAAAERGQVPAIEALFRLGSRAINSKDNLGRSLFHAAVDYLAYVKTMSQLHARLIKNDLSDDFLEQYKPQPALLETLVRLGCEHIDARDNAGQTPLRLAAGHGLAEAVEQLAMLGSNAVDVRDNLGVSPLLAATRIHSKDERYSSAAVARVLRALGVDLADATTDQWATIRRQPVEVTEDEMSEIRQRVYFARSLMHRLLFELQRQNSIASTAAH